MRGCDEGKTDQIQRKEIRYVGLSGVAVAAPFFINRTMNNLSDCTLEKPAGTQQAGACLQKVFDPLRKKEVPLTPEEQVRQWCISELLAKAAGVPMHLMMSEVGFRYGGKQYRADILVYDRSARPLALVECKRPDVVLSAKVAEQALRYNAVLDIDYVILTNGFATKVFCRNGESFQSCPELPRYEEMLSRASK